MKRKLLLGLMLTSMLSANSFAMKITHGKLLSHKEWTTGKFLNASFKEGDNFKIPALQMPSHKMHSAGEGQEGIDTIDPFNWVYGDLQAVVGQDLTLSGQAMVQIRNDSPVSKTYTITTSLESCSGEVSQICAVTAQATSQNTVVLDVGGYLDLGQVSYATVNFSAAGQSYYWIETDVQVDGGTLFESTSNSGLITVTDSSVRK